MLEELGCKSDTDLKLLLHNMVSELESLKVANKSVKEFRISRQTGKPVANPSPNTPLFYNLRKLLDKLLTEQQQQQNTQ